MSQYRFGSKIWYSSTTGKFLCRGCALFNIYNKKCAISKNDTSSSITYASCCDCYVLRKGTHD